MKIAVLFLMSFMIIHSANASGPQCVAHRSLGFGGLENSMEAFKKATHAGVVALEFDIHHTKDGQSLVYHDDVLKRDLIGHPAILGKKIKDLSFKDIRKNLKLTNGEDIPTLEEAINFLSSSSASIYLEVKDRYISEEDFQTLLTFYGTRMEQITIISFNETVLDIVENKKRDDVSFSKIKTLLLDRRASFFTSKKYDGIDVKFINPLVVWYFHKKGKIVGVYTKNNADEIKKYQRLGVDFITTDNYPLCLSLISE